MQRPLPRQLIPRAWLIWDELGVGDVVVKAQESEMKSRKMDRKGGGGSITEAIVRDIEYQKSRTCSLCRLFVSALCLGTRSIREVG